MMTKLVFKLVILLLTAFILATSRTTKKPVDHSSGILKSGEDCLIGLPRASDVFSGFPRLTKDHVTVEFIANSDNSNIARVRWTAPNVLNGPPVDSYLFSWYSPLYRKPNCIRFRNTTTTYDIKESIGWKSNWTLHIIILPLPNIFNGSQAMDFHPVYHDNHAKTSVPKTSEDSPTATTILLQYNTIFLPDSKNEKARDSQGDDRIESVSEIVGISVTAVLGVIILVSMAIMLLRCFNRVKNYFTAISKPDLPNDDDDLIYVSYFPELTSFNNKVVEFTSWFIKKGYDVQMDLMLGPDNQLRLRELGRIRFTELQLQKAKYIFMIVSPAYLKLCQQNSEEKSFDNLSKEGKIVYSEIMYIRNELCTAVFRNSRFIPVLFGVEETELPFWMKELVVFSWPEDKKNQRLLYRLNEQLEYTTDSYNTFKKEEFTTAKI